MAHIISKQTGKAIVTYFDCKYSPTVGLQYLSCCVALILVLLTIAHIIMTIHVFSMNTAGGDSSRQSCKVCYIWRPRLPIRPSDERPPAMYVHFCLVLRVSVHDRYYCSAKSIYSSEHFTIKKVWHCIIKINKKWKSGSVPSEELVTTARWVLTG